MRPSDSPDEPDHRRVHVEAQQPRLRVWKRFQESAGYHAKHLFIQLMQREPLTEQAAGRESLANGLEMFECVK